MIQILLVIQMNNIIWVILFFRDWPRTDTTIFRSFNRRFDCWQWSRTDLKSQFFIFFFRVKFLDLMNIYGPFMGCIISKSSSKILFRVIQLSKWNILMVPKQVSSLFSQECADQDTIIFHWNHILNTLSKHWSKFWFLDKYHLNISKFKSFVKFSDPRW